MRAGLVQLAQKALADWREGDRPSLAVVHPAPDPGRSDAPDAREATREDRDSLTFDSEAPLVGKLFAKVSLSWLRSARAGSAPEAGLAWLKARARDLAPDLDEGDLETLALRCLARLCSLSPAPGRDLAERAWDLLGGQDGGQEGAAPALRLYRDQEGRPWESWLVATPSDLALMLKGRGATLRPVPGRPWARFDRPAGAVSRDLVAQLVEACPADLEAPDEALLAERERLAEERHPARPDLFTKVDAAELVALVPLPAPPPGLPEDCPACRSRNPRWKALEEPGRFLCGRCWQGLTVTEEDRP